MVLLVGYRKEVQYFCLQYSYMLKFEKVKKIKPVSSASSQMLHTHIWL